VAISRSAAVLREGGAPEDALVRAGYLRQSTLPVGSLQPGDAEPSQGLLFCASSAVEIERHSLFAQLIALSTGANATNQEVPIKVSRPIGKDNVVPEFDFLRSA
jgi:hypothetical protein